MTQLISFLWKNENKKSHDLLQLHVGREALAYCQCLYREKKALFVSVVLIGEKNQVILECAFLYMFNSNWLILKHSWLSIVKIKHTCWREA